VVSFGSSGDSRSGSRSGDERGGLSGCYYRLGFYDGGIQPAMNEEVHRPKHSFSELVTAGRVLPVVSPLPKVWDLGCKCITQQPEEAGWPPAPQPPWG